ncbi:hypothetical protein TrLO_g13545 [Triparma laevis f. longispina]|uniref:Uncharacterized protein n=1 Tax=Triparma laevis f. longispina TaxID=1714387 RepID=A0A9W7C218_9STRA|nr:hypothetical protein TrLO_g13545 [Triparma laevis f. longispina]
MIKRAAKEQGSPDSPNAKRQRRSIADESNAQELLRLLESYELVICIGPESSNKTASALMVQSSTQYDTTVVNSFDELAAALDSKDGAVADGRRLILDCPADAAPPPNLRDLLDSRILSWTTMEFYVLSPRELLNMAQRCRDLNEGVDKITDLFTESLQAG